MDGGLMRYLDLNEEWKSIELNVSFHPIEVAVGSSQRTNIVVSLHLAVSYVSESERKTAGKVWFPVVIDGQND